MKNQSRLQLDAIQNLTQADQLLFEQFGMGPTVKPPYACVHHAIEAQAKLYPKSIAVEHFHESITYKELNDRAEQLSQVLENHGVAQGDHVALFLQRSIPMIVGILASMKVGAAYVPQHVGVAPTEQLIHVLMITLAKQSAKVILTLSYLRHLIPNPCGATIVEIDELMAQTLTPKPRPLKPKHEVRGETVCFVLFTSGTTGRPNGVQVTHANVCNIILTTPGNLGIQPGMKVSQVLSIAFDMAAWEILTCLSHGATLVIRGKSIQETVEKVDIVIATPTILTAIDADRCPNVKAVAVAGEPCPRALADKWGSFARFYNSCGPTETTIVNTMQLHTPQTEKFSIGKPIPNNTVYILDENRQPCAIGEVGEMWAGGACVSKGYLSNPSLTAERYVADPFLGGDHIMFHTRDLGRWTLDGELEHFGRTDDQVKIRGFRVELDSISAVLESVPNCQRAATLKLNDRNLVSFVSPGTVLVDDAKSAVARLLPYYCIPSHIVALDALPLTPNGKVDKRALTVLAVNTQEQSIEVSPHLESVQ